MAWRTLLACLCVLTLTGCCSLFSTDDDSDESEESEEDEPRKKKSKKTKKSKKSDAAGDVPAGEVKAMRAQLQCSDRVEGYFCKALDGFFTGGPPAPPRGTWFYPGVSLSVKTTQGKLTTQEASYYISQPDAAAFDSIIPETAQEKRQRERYYQYFLTGKLPPRTDPLVKFCATLSTSVVAPAKVKGQSLRFDRPLPGGKKNSIYVRETRDQLVIVEIAPEPLGLQFFFVGVFPKALKLAGTSK